MKILHIVESAYRATLEEKDDAVLWFVHMLRQKAGADCTVLLRGHAVNYLSKRQRVAELRLGKRLLGNLPRLADDVAAMIQHGIPVYYVDEDAGECGIDSADMIAGGKPVPRNALARLVAQYDRVFHW
jgi:hypothetical protein